MESYCDALSYIYKLFRENPPTSSAQLVMLHLLHENYCLGNTGTVLISDRELGLRTRLSKQTITEAKRTLKNRGLIDFKTDRDKPHKATTYTILISEKVGQAVGQRVGQTLGQRVGQTSFISYTLNEAQSTNSNTTQTQNRSSTYSNYSSKDDDDIKNNPSDNLKKEKEKNTPQSSSSSSVEELIKKKSDVEEKNDDDDGGLVFKKLWEVRTESKLTDSESLKLEELGKLYGYRLFEKVLTKCIRFKGSELHFNYFLAAMTDEVEKKRKGGEKVGRRTDTLNAGKPKPERPADTEIAPWERGDS